VGVACSFSIEPIPSPNLRLAQFISENAGPILVEWESFARTRIPAAATMDTMSLRDHAADMLQAFSDDLQASQTEDERSLKAQGLAVATEQGSSAASLHGAIRHSDGFDLTQLASEFRALRAAVLRLWKADHAAPDSIDLDDFERFNESVDQALAESIAAYSAKIAESRDTFLAVLGHDLRQPLSAMRGCLELLQRPETTDARKVRALGIARRSATSMEELITDLLEYTKTRLGRGVEVVPMPGSFSHLIEEVVEQARAAHPKAAFVFDSPADCQAEFDPARMRQVVSNLLSNAVQYGDHGTPIVVAITEAGDQAVLRVTNRGREISPEALQVIFNPLVQIASRHTEPHERPATSMGLGLFIAREIVEAHGGTIVATSSEEAGTTFAVSISKHQLH
jgi:signal transduction histidine kinase